MKKGQDQIKKDDVKLKGLSAEALNEMDSLSKTKVAPKTRIVTLQYKSCCGCGCDYHDITREVPYDSDLSDGDIVHSFEANDQYV